MRRRRAESVKSFERKNARAAIDDGWTSESASVQASSRRHPARRQPARSSSPAAADPRPRSWGSTASTVTSRGVLRIERQPVEALRVLAAAFTLPWGPAGKTHQPAESSATNRSDAGGSVCRKLGRGERTGRPRQPVGPSRQRVERWAAGFGARACSLGSFGSFGSPASSAPSWPRIRAVAPHTRSPSTG